MQLVLIKSQRSLITNQHNQFWTATVPWCSFPIYLFLAMPSPTFYLLLCKETDLIDLVFTDSEILLDSPRSPHPSCQFGLELRKEIERWGPVPLERLGVFCLTSWLCAWPNLIPRPELQVVCYWVHTVKRLATINKLSRRASLLLDKKHPSICIEFFDYGTRVTLNEWVPVFVFGTLSWLLESF